MDWIGLDWMIETVTIIIIVVEQLMNNKVINKLHYTCLWMVKLGIWIISIVLGQLIGRHGV